MVTFCKLGVPPYSIQGVLIFKTLLLGGDYRARISDYVYDHILVLGAVLAIR